MTTLEQTSSEQSQLIAGHRRRRIREAITGYLFVLPATAATFMFGLWPVVSGFYESLKSGSPITNRYVGLDNYVRSMGSLAYILIFALCIIFIYASERSWSGARRQAAGDGLTLWYYLVPALLTGLGLIVLSLILVTSLGGWTWFPVTVLALAVGGFFTADHLQRPREDWDFTALALTWGLLLVIVLVWSVLPELLPGTVGLLVTMGVLAFLFTRVLPYISQIKTGATIMSMVLMGTLLLLAILLGRYSIAQMDATVEEAQEISTLIFNQNVLDGSVLVSEDDTRISNLSFEEDEVLVRVDVDGEEIIAPLAPQVYSEVPAESISYVEVAFANNQRVQVLLPDGTVAEGQITGLPAGEYLTVPFQAEDPVAIHEEDIYSALDVGEAVVRADGHTEPLIKQIYATLLVLMSIATIFTMGWVRGRIDDEEAPRAHRWLHYGRVVLVFVALIAFFYLLGALQLNRQAAAGMGALTEEQFDSAYEYVIGEKPPAVLRAEELKAQLLYWPQVLSVGMGAFLIGMAYLVWQGAQKRETPLGVGLAVLMALLMMIGGWLMIGELPQTLDMGGREAEEAMDSLMRTVMYSIGTVPVQLTLGLLLAYLLFSEITWGKSLFRVVYFMPYIAPSVATSTVFLVIFRFEDTSLANRAVGLLGFDALNWLKEPDGVVRIFYEQILGGNPLHIPESLAGPSLALTTVIIYNIWVFAGYNAVVFLAGLGAIPGELYEAAEVDGAGRWSRFRNITLPLLSPTTFFLSMLSIIGTFKAFSHIYVLRGQAVGKEIDTMSVHIFNTLYSANDPGYAAALAFSLFGVILILTLVQNRLAREQVFYG